MSTPLVFLHIHKTGGTTLTSFLDAQFALSDIFPAQQWYQWDEWVKAKSHWRVYRLYRGHFNLSQVLSLPAPRFVVLLRDPVERVISEYFHWRRAPEKFILHNPAYRRVWTLARSVSLEEFLEREEETDFFVANRQTYQLGLPVSMPRPQKICSEDEVLRWAKETLRSFDFVGVIEDLAGLIERLCWAYHWLLPKQIPVLRAARESKEIPADLRKQIARFTALDGELYAFARALAQQQHRRYFSLEPAYVHRAIEQRYRQAFEKRFGPPRARWQWDCTQPIPGDGWVPRWQIRKGKNTYWVCWSCARSSFLDLPLDRSKRLMLHIEVADLAVMPQEVRFVVNGRALPVRWVREEDRWIAEVLLPPCREGSRAITRVWFEHIRMGEVIPPYQGKPIECGVALSRVEAFPLSFWRSVGWKVASLFEQVRRVVRSVLG